MVPPAPRGDLEAAADQLAELRDHLERVMVDAALTPADRSFLASVASRVDAMAGTLRHRATPRTPTAPPKLPERHWTRKEAALVLKVHPNTLLLWHEKGLLVPKVDAKGWRVYSPADIQRGMAILAHVPLDQLPETD